CIKTIYDKNGKTIYRSFPTFKMVSDARSVEMLRPILQDVVRKGTARRISYITNYFDVAGKTGTTNNFRDAYFTGFTTSFVMSIWFGRDSYKPMWRNAEGGNVAAPPWARIAMDICRTYGCGKFNPSYDEIVNAYPKPTRLPRNVYTETIGGTLDGSSYLNLLTN
ncbi:MAG: hypothetical protein GWP10_05610, partial [Nitrospiraceae bacterium]|nr:hypothetical protein [Nitrospiraceae bacterium]